MAKGVSVVVVVALFVIAGVAALAYFVSSNGVPDRTACTLEAKICPDGSSVGRTGPNCEFAACPTAQTSPVSAEEFEPFTAGFEIYTKGTRRVFSAAMYRHQSEDEYIGDGNSNIVIVEKDGTTWGEFFGTLPSPFSLDKYCLTTETGQTFCTGSEGVLKFYLNGEEASNALSLPIKPRDVLTIRYE